MSFVAVDWGSTRFRAYRVEDGAVSDRIVSARGILSTAPADLAGALLEELRPWRAWIEREQIPVSMAGMIGSNRGLRDAGYRRLPVFLDVLASTSTAVEVETPLATTVAIRPGLALADGDAYDVMRGEEVQLLGAFRIRPATLYLFPGTHTKWVPVERVAGRAHVRTFSTMMTGELYAWLIGSSMVSRGLPVAPPWNDDAFSRGIARATRAGDVVEEMFRTRARWLLGDVAPEAVPSYLSGLLIGHELVAMTNRYGAKEPLVIVGDEHLCTLYQKAAAQLFTADTSIIPDEAAMIEGFRSFHDGH